MSEESKELSASEILTSLREEREKNEKALEEMRKIQTETMKLAVRSAMGGTAQAGQLPPKERTIDDDAQDMADSVVKKIWGKL